MIKLTFCLKRLPHLSREEFQSYWRDTHAPLVREHADVLKIARYVQSHSFPESASAPLAQARGSAGKDFDGVAELWWTDMESFASAGMTAEGQEAGRILLEDEARFIDLANSPIFLVDEFEVIGR
ncbi:EthD family reductase [Sphingorhabdus pulchriflava]|uniref:EthD family reductase n=1 Tax=Sphingorhabdus pulchriflava TaxID=2292257 RepID=A0A371BFB9_9SPHN|nr:EthD domain-containing protein [Sphingorhabdus pulchriflava]RDV06302.1 EthD family reductase [Sphingorhabdus pulchriflava]